MHPACVASGVGLLADEEETLFRAGRSVPRGRWNSTDGSSVPWVRTPWDWRSWGSFTNAEAPVTRVAQVCHCPAEAAESVG